MNFGVAFEPLISLPWLTAAAVVAMLVALLPIVSRARGAWVRAVAILLALIALANPSFTREDREPLTSVVAVVTDKSPSQRFGDRLSATDAARVALTERLGKIPGLEVRLVDGGTEAGADGTRLFAGTRRRPRRRSARARGRRHPRHRRPRP